MNKIKQAIVGLAMAAGALGGVGLVSTSAEAAPAPTPVVQQAPASTQSAAGNRLSIVSDKWGLWHGKAVSVQTGRQTYYGPGRFFRSDAWDDVHDWADGL